jgi:Ras GTPase-activating-like protein IQGAP2/3
VRGHPAYIGVAVNYIRPKQATYVREALQTVVRDVINSDELDLEVDPSLIYRTRVQLEDMRRGVQSDPGELSFHQALKDPPTRAEFIRRWWTSFFSNRGTYS